MPLFTERRLRNRAKKYIEKEFEGTSFNYQAKARFTLTMFNTIQYQLLTSPHTIDTTYDIFLSHSSNDAEIVLGLKLEIEKLGLSVYIDWIEDPSLNRSNVTKETALLLRERMKNCKSLIYAFSENASNSKWMPWELGYFDGLKGTVAVLPISKTNKSSFKGSEYLGIYYYIQIGNIETTNNETLCVHKSSSKYIYFNSWIKGNTL
ncbi:toll/interleukin-1 receptor domain-containing protein [Aquimarina rhabdastrellae]